MDFKNFKITDYRDSVSTLPDYPSDANITATQLKAIFDSRTDNEIKEKFNALIDELITQFGLVEVGIADSVENHNQDESAHEKIISPIQTRIAEILAELITINDNITNAGNVINTLDQALSEVLNETGEHAGNRENPHKVTAKQIGLGNVDNTPDSKKVVFEAEHSFEAVCAQMDWLGNVIHETYATKDEVGDVDLSGYYTKGEVDAKFVAEEIYANDMATFDQLVYQNIDDIAELKASMGEIDTALDSILAIQNELVGG